MSLQVRITDADGSNPVILDEAENINYFKAINSSDEGVSFEIAKNSAKADVVNPDTEGYKKFWEVWETSTNTRKNYGPLTEVAESGPQWKVTGAGRSALLLDFYKTKKTFYASIDSIVDDLRYENIAIQPRTTTKVTDVPHAGSKTTVFGTGVFPNSKYFGLSKQTKDNVIDDNTGLFKPGQIEPVNTYTTTDSYWAGMSRQDSHIVDLGDVYPISKVTLVLPWWGGKQRVGNRTFEFSLDYGIDSEVPVTNYRGTRYGPFHEFYTTESDRLIMGADPTSYYFGTSASGTSFDHPVYYVKQDITGPLNMRYIRTRIDDVHAWYGSVFDGQPPNDGWAFQCDPNYQPGDLPFITSSAPGIMHGSVISDRVLEPQNDCFASIVEIGAYKEILPRDTVKPLALQRIDNNNLQITYSHAVDSGEMETTEEGYRKYEPGGFFRRFSINWSGASSTYTKFYDSDCANCYPDGFALGVVDQHNNLVYSSDSSSGTGVDIKTSSYSSSILIKGASNATVTTVDTWQSVVDPLSWGGNYSYTEIANDYAVVHFRGQSFKWYATIPSTEIGAEVKIEIRHKTEPRMVAVGTPGGGLTWATDSWSSWSTLENNYPLPNNISAEVVYEITYESGTLLADTVYEIRITNLDGGFCSIDSFEGYWSGSLNSYNEDSHRINISHPEKFVQIYDKRFSGGSMYKWNSGGSFMNFKFEGDRAIIYSARGRYHGKLSIIMMRTSGKPIYDEYPNSNTLRIPGGDVNGGYTIDLNTGKRGVEVTQAVVFDTNDVFPDGLPWDKYMIAAYLLPENLETFSTSNPHQFDNFSDRCSDCVAQTGTPSDIYKYVYLDGIAAHEKVGLSVSFENETHQDILKSVAEAIQSEWDVTEDGIRLEPRLGQDTNEVLREGHNTLVDWNLVNDVSKIATMLVSSGADIDGLPLFTITEDKNTRADIGRTIMRKEDFRNIADYFQLVGLSRTNLRKRKVPEKRISVTHVASELNLNEGDSFILFTKKQGPLRVRLIRKSQIQSVSSGTVFELECIKWPQII